MSTLLIMARRTRLCHCFCRNAISSSPAADESDDEAWFRELVCILYILIDILQGRRYLYVCACITSWRGEMERKERSREVGEATTNSSHMIHPTGVALTLATAHRHKHTAQEAAPGLANELLHKNGVQH